MWDFILLLDIFAVTTGLLSIGFLGLACFLPDTKEDVRILKKRTFHAYDRHLSLFGRPFFDKVTTRSEKNLCLGMVFAFVFFFHFLITVCFTF